MKDKNLKITLIKGDEFDYFLEEWNGFMSSEAFRKVLMDSIAVYETHSKNAKVLNGKLLLLADAIDLAVVKEEDMAWLADHINPLYETCGFTHQAVIMPKNFFGQMSVKNYEEFSKSGNLLTNVFPSAEEAIEWYKKDQKLAN